MSKASIDRWANKSECKIERSYLIFTDIWPIRTQHLPSQHWEFVTSINVLAEISRKKKSKMIHIYKHQGFISITFSRNLH